MNEILYVAFITKRAANFQSGFLNHRNELYTTSAAAGVSETGYTSDPRRIQIVAFDKGKIDNIGNTS